ncbi:hypothetical protein RU98_GL002938 [Enterococcus caccae]|nr:hypothetical protein RU98_GL002938 [Enterococcus caccae]
MEMYRFTHQQHEHFYRYLETLDCYITSETGMIEELQAFEHDDKRQIASLVCQNTKGTLKFSAPYLRILYILEGEVKLLLDGKELYHCAGTLILSNQYTTIDYEELSLETKIVSFYFKSDYFSDSLLNQLSEETSLYRFFVESLKKQDEKIGRYYVFAFDTTDDVHFYCLLLLKQIVKMRYFNNKVTKSAFLLLIVEISQLADKALCIKDSFISSELLIFEVLGYMENHLQTVTLENVAKKFHFHPNYLSSLVKQNTQQTFTECLIALRLNYAKQYLTQTDLTIQEIIENLGYSDKAFFFKVFKKETGYTPGAYRRAKKF